MKKLKVILIILLFIPFIVKADSLFLYDVLKNEAESDGLAKEYTGEHQDSITKEATDNIYHWYANNDADGVLVDNKNNVVFGGFCWKIIRTTDIGGVRLMYNGKIATDGTCNGSTTEPTLSFDNRSQYVGGRPYYYASSYTYDETTKKYTLSSDATLITYDGSNLDQIKNKYTCLKSDTTPCDYIYYIFRDTNYGGATNTWVLGLSLRSTTTRNASIGTTTYNDAVTSPNGAGYLRSSKRNKHVNYYWEYYMMLEESASINSSTYVGDSLQWNESKRCWELTNAKYMDEYSSSQLVGKFTFGNNYTCGENLRYIFSTNTSTYKYYTVLNQSLTAHMEVTDTVYYSDTYTDNNDGTYTLGSSEPFLRSDLRSNYSKLLKKYICTNGTPDNCYEIWYVSSGNTGGLSRTTTGLKKLYSNSYTYSNGKYHLTGEYYYFWNSALESEKAIVSTHRYTCMNMQNECDTLYYIVGTYTSNFYYVALNDGETSESIFDSFFTDNDEDSDAKSAVDFWYEHELIKYGDYLEDSVYCNNRSVTSKGGWADNGNTSDIIYSNDQFNGNDLKCFNETDQLSVSNPTAQLKYPIALPTTQELLLSNNRYTRSTNTTTWLMTPDDFLAAYLCNTLMYSGGYISSCSNVSRNYGLSPAITLKKGAYVTSGDGSLANPYIVDKLMSRINVDIVNETEDITIEIDDLTQVEYGEPTRFTVTPKEGYTLGDLKILDEDGNEILYEPTGNENEYEFIMPASDITINPTYRRVTSGISIIDDIYTREFEIEVNDVQAIVYEDEVKIRIVPEEGYELVDIEIYDEKGNRIEYQKTDKENEYSFIMPSTNVSIKPIYRKVAGTNLSENPNTEDNSLKLLIVMILFLLITFVLYKKEKDLA